MAKATTTKNKIISHHGTLITTIRSVLPGLYYQASPTQRNRTKSRRHRRPHVACATSVTRSLGYACFPPVPSRHWIGEPGLRLPAAVRAAHGGGLRDHWCAARRAVARRGPSQGPFPGPTPGADR